MTSDTRRVHGRMRLLLIALLEAGTAALSAQTPPFVKGSINIPEIDLAKFSGAPAANKGAAPAARRARLR